jgi:hypothetical protein
MASIILNNCHQQNNFYHIYLRIAANIAKLPELLREAQAGQTSKRVSYLEPL